MPRKPAPKTPLNKLYRLSFQSLRDAARVAPREGAEQVKQGFSALGLVNTTRCASWHPRGVDRSLRQVRDCPKGDGKRNRGLE